MAAVVKLVAEAASTVSVPSARAGKNLSLISVSMFDVQERLHVGTPDLGPRETCTTGVAQA